MIKGMVGFEFDSELDNFRIGWLLVWDLILFGCVIVCVCGVVY